MDFSNKNRNVADLKFHKTNYEFYVFLLLCAELFILAFIALKREWI